MRENLNDYAWRFVFLNNNNYIMANTFRVIIWRLIVRDNGKQNLYLKYTSAQNIKILLLKMLGYGLIGKLQIFVLTFLSYVSIHSLRTAYSYSKHHIAVAIGTDKSMLGLVDTSMLLSLGIGFLYHALVPNKKPVRNLSIALLVCAITYAIVPFAIDNGFSNIETILLLMTVNGFVQSFTWSNLLVIVNSRWDKSRNSTALGFWATNANVGNILGFAICEEVNLLQRPWEEEMYCTAALTFVMGILVLWRIKQIQVTDKNAQQNKQQLSILKIISQPAVLFVSATLSCVKAVIYGIMLWLPMYFHNIGLAEYSTYIPIGYDVFCIVGSIGLGYLFGKVRVKGLLLAPLMVLLVVCFYVLKFFQVTVFWYFAIIAVVGMCLGGSFNTIVGLSTIQLTESLPKQQQRASLGLYSAVTMAIANLVTAFTQLLIGFVVGKDQQSIFIIFMVYSALAFVCFACGAYREFNEQQSSKQHYVHKQKQH